MYITNAKSDMEEISEITEFPEDEIDLLKQRKNDEIEIGLEIVALEMGNILEELKDNLERLSWVKDPGVDCQTHNKTVDKTQNKKINENNTLNSEIRTNGYLANSDKYQQKPSISSYKRSSKLKVSSKDEQIKPNSKATKPTRAKKKLWGEGSYTEAAKSVNSKPTYNVQRTKYGSVSMSPSRIHSEQITPYSRRTSIIQCSKRSSTSSTTSSITYSKLWQPNDVNKKPSIGIWNRPSVIDQTLKSLKDRVDCAIRDKKTFTVCGNYYTIRRALVSRGWVEKIRILYNTFDRENLRRLQAASIPELLHGASDPKNGYVYKRMIMSKLLGQHQVDFYWDQNADCFRINRDSVKLTIINRFRRGIFSYTSKQGLCESMKKAYWFQFPGIAHVQHPRSYNLANSEDPKHFINDFKLTAAMSLLKWICKQQGNPRTSIICPTGKVPLKVYHFAINELSKAVRRCKHEDIDYDIEEALDYQWNEFLENFYKVVHIGDRFKPDEKDTSNSITLGAKNMLKKVEKFWPHLNMDGLMNIWILKPTNGSRGEGIYLCRTLQYILKIIRSNTTRRYVVQKYIERPLLIHSTKFDIRQWFVITSAAPLTIWIYKDCYVRFSSQLFTLHKLHESVHLTNNSVQSRYKNCVRNSALPDCNMWDSKQFKKYLASVGQPKVYTDIIYPGMKECLTGAILMNQANIDTRKNCFELYGSDFMLTEDYQPWLIEINSRPALYPSTPITARMCPQVLDDLIRVIIDYPKNPNAATGRFELLYKEEIHKLPKVDPQALQLKGQELPESYFYNPDTSKHSKEPTLATPTTPPSKGCTSHTIKSISSEMKKTLENLLTLIQVERDRRKKLRSQSSPVAQIDVCRDMKLESGKDTNYYTENTYEISDDRADSDAITLKVIESVASNLEKAKSAINTLVSTQIKNTAEINDTSSQIVSNNTVVTNLENATNASIFTDMIKSIRNISFAYRSTQI